MKQSRILFAFSFVLAAGTTLFFNKLIIGIMMLYILGFILSLSIISIIYIKLNFRVSQRIKSKHLFKNEKLGYEISINKKVTTYISRITYEFYNGQKLNYKESGGNNACLKKYEINFPYRGVYKIGLKSITVNDFFGLFKISIKPDVLTEVYVYPSPAGSVMIKYTDEVQHNITQKKYGSEDYTSVADIRQYIESDNARRIHWKLSAKRGELLVKNYDNLEPKPMILALDTFCLDMHPYSRSFVEDRMVSYILTALMDFSEKRIPIDFLYGREPEERYLIAAEDSIDNALYLLASINFKYEEPVLPEKLRAFKIGTENRNIFVYTANFCIDIFNELKELTECGHSVFLYSFIIDKIPGIENEPLYDVLESYGAYIERIPLKIDKVEYKEAKNLLWNGSEAAV